MLSLGWLLLMRNIPRGRRELAAFHSLVFFLHPRDVAGIFFHPKRDGRALVFLVQLSELDDHVFARIAAQVVQLAHVDAVGRARLSSQGTEQALAVVDRVT